IEVISVEGDKWRGLRLGAVDFLEKPVTREKLMDTLAAISNFIERPARTLLVVEDDEIARQSIVELIGNGDVQTTAVGSGQEALAVLKSQQFDCLVLDIGLPDMTGLELIRKIQEELKLTNLPIVVYTGKELSKKEQTELLKLTEAVIVKDVKSPERLLDETALFLHRVQSHLPEPKRKMLQGLREADPWLAGRKVLVVDDDVRNLFALASVLEQNKMVVSYAESGREALEVPEQNPDTDILLMDVMMPDMDGYETTRAIRNMEAFASLPVIALTAKAMK